MNAWSLFRTATRTGAPQIPEEVGDRVKSMHEDIPDWYDCCSCEAEPYWLAAMGEELRTEPDCEGGGAEPGGKA